MDELITFVIHVRICDCSEEPWETVGISMRADDISLYVYPREEVFAPAMS